MSKPKPRRKHPDSNAMPAPDVPRSELAKPGEPGYWFPTEQYVGIRVTCRTCGDGRRVGLVALFTFPEDDGEPWFEGESVDPGGSTTLLVLRCRRGHSVSLPLDEVTERLESMKSAAGPNGRRVVTEER